MHHRHREPLSGRRAEGVAGPRSFWQAPPVAVDVAIVGGGIAGLSCLVACRERGVAAVLLERDWCGAGATGRNAGILGSGAPMPYAAAVDAFGRARAADMVAFSAANHAHLLEAVAGHDVGYRRLGHETWAADPAEAQLLERSVALLREDGYTAEWDTAAAAPLDDLLGRAVFPDDAELDSYRVVRALASRWPTAVHCGAEVLGLETAGAAVRLHLADGVVVAGAVVLATNAFTRGLCAELPIAPVRAQMLASAPVATTYVPRPASSRWGFQYWRQTPDGSVLVGGSRDRALAAEVGYGLRPTLVVQRHLEAHLRRLGVGAPVVRRWAGTMGFTPDSLPLVGPVPGRRHVFAVAGFTGHGMALAVEASRTLADHLAGGPLPPDWLRPDREWPAAATTGERPPLPAWAPPVPAAGAATG